MYRKKKITTKLGLTKRIEKNAHVPRATNPVNLFIRFECVCGRVILFFSFLFLLFFFPCSLRIAETCDARVKKKKINKQTPYPPVLHTLHYICFSRAYVRDFLTFGIQNSFLLRPLMCKNVPCWKFYKLVNTASILIANSVRITNFPKTWSVATLRHFTCG